MNLSEPHPERPHELTGVKLDDRQVVRDEERRNRWLLALVGRSRAGPLRTPLRAMRPTSSSRSSTRSACATPRFIDVLKTLRKLGLDSTQPI